MRADEPPRRNVRRRRDLKRSGPQIGAELRRHSAQLLSLLDVLAGNVPGRLALVVARAAGDEAGVQRRAAFQAASSVLYASSSLTTSNSLPNAVVLSASPPCG